MIKGDTGGYKHVLNMA